MVFETIPVIPFEGADSKNPLAFKFYDPERIVLGKKMKEHLPFALSWWHTLCAEGADMFGRGSADKAFGAKRKGDMEHAFKKVDAGFEMMQKLGIEYFCFHDVDLVPECEDINEMYARLDQIGDYLLKKMGETGIKCLWGTANLFGNPRYMNGAGSSNDLDVYSFACAQVKKAINLTIKLGGKGFVFWGGREGYETLLNTDVKKETDHIASLMKMAVAYARGKGFQGDFYIEPKPKEPSKHQYDYDAATSILFLKEHGLDKDFKLNIEANHATLAGHTFEHELRIAAIHGMLGSIDANEGDPNIGWDVDRFPADVYTATYAMLEVLRAGGLTGGFNFDAKTRRPSNTAEDLFSAYILGMDTYALGLLCAAKIIEDGRIDNFVKERYSSFDSALGKRIEAGETSLEEMADLALAKRVSPLPESGKQEQLEAIVNQLLFGAK